MRADYRLHVVLLDFVDIDGWQELAVLLHLRPRVDFQVRVSVHVTELLDLLHHQLVHSLLHSEVMIRSEECVLLEGGLQNRFIAELVLVDQPLQESLLADAEELLGLPRKRLRDSADVILALVVLLELKYIHSGWYILLETLIQGVYQISVQLVDFVVQRQVPVLVHLAVVVAHRVLELHCIELRLVQRFQGLLFALLLVLDLDELLVPQLRVVLHSLLALH